MVIETALPNPIARRTDSEPVFGGTNPGMYEEDDEFVLTFEVPVVWARNRPFREDGSRRLNV
jgi:hypothetical protein